MTTNSISHNRTLFLEDNLPVLRGLDSDSIDLIATDPPFNKGVPAFKGTTKAGQNVEFKDVWNWDEDVHVDWTNSILGRHPSLYAAIDSANKTAGYDMGAFLCWMGVRVLEMHRVLKDTGSLYLHCDQTASHYLKAMMDAIFGRKQFRNEIVWGYAPSGRAPKYGFHRKHDVIFYYSKGATPTFNHLYTEMTDTTRKTYKFVDETGRKYKESPGGRSYLDEQVGRPIPSWWTDIKSFGTATQSKERTGYPTQKPLALYKRMIQASSNPGDMVLDPFAGCATTAVAAEQLGRQWIGIDIREESGGGGSGSSAARGFREYGVERHRSDSDDGSRANGWRRAGCARAGGSRTEAECPADIRVQAAGGVGREGWPAMPGLRVGAESCGLPAG